MQPVIDALIAYGVSPAQDCISSPTAISPPTAMPCSAAEVTAAMGFGRYDLLSICSGKITLNYENELVTRKNNFMDYVNNTVAVENDPDAAKPWEEALRLTQVDRLDMLFNCCSNPKDPILRALILEISVLEDKTEIIQYLFGNHCNETDINRFMIEHALEYALRWQKYKSYQIINAALSDLHPALAFFINVDSTVSNPSCLKFNQVGHKDWFLSLHPVLWKNRGHIKAAARELEQIESTLYQRLRLMNIDRTYYRIMNTLTATNWWNFAAIPGQRADMTTVPRPAGKPTHPHPNGWGWEGISSRRG